MDENQFPAPIITRRRVHREEEHHGGAWKIAFADFMTAMMALFLVLWIINATDKNTKTLIARYFNPVKLQEAARTTRSIHGDPAAIGEAGPTTVKSQSGDAAASPDGSVADEPKDAPISDRHGVNFSAKHGDPASPRPTMSEGVLFADPYRSLDVIAGPASVDARAVAESERTREGVETGSAPRDALRDPFRPIGAELTFVPAAPAPQPSLAATPTPTSTSTPAPTPAPPSAASATPAPPAASPSPQPTSSPVAAAAPQTSMAASAGRLKKEIDLQMALLGQSRLGPAVDVQATDEGLLISLTDRMNFAMFPIGSAEPQRAVVQAMDAIARDLKERPGVIVVRGHTDGHPYRSKTYDNWRLSSARAQMAYYMLARAGLDPSRFERIEGWADRRLKDPKQPFAAENRRIEILLQERKP